MLRVQSDGASCAVLMAQPCHHNICPAARVAKYNSTTCGEQRAIRLENVRQGLGEGQWVQRHDGRVVLRMNSTVPQEGDASHHHGELLAANGSPQILLTPRSPGLLRGPHISVSGVRLVLSAFSGTATAVGWPDTQAGNAATGIRDGKAAPRGQVCPVLAAIVAEQGRVSNCSFAHLGGAGVHLRSGVVEDSAFSDLSGGAVLLGTHDPETPSSGTVRCNVIQHVGVECTAMWKAAAQRLRPTRPRRPPALISPASARASAGRFPASASLGQPRPMGRYVRAGRLYTGGVVLIGTRAPRGSPLATCEARSSGATCSPTCRTQLSRWAGGGGSSACVLRARARCRAAPPLATTWSRVTRCSPPTSVA